MSGALTFLVALLTAALGTLLGGLVANAAVGWHRVSSFEGLAGYGVVAGGLVGGLVGFALGLAAGRLAGGPGAAGLARGLGAAAGVALAAAGVATLLAWLTAEHEPTIGGRPLDLEVELRVATSAAPSLPPADVEQARVVLYGADRRQQRMAPLRTEDARVEDGHWIVPATVAITSSRAPRLLGFQLGPGDPEYHEPPLRGRPGPEDEVWTGWLPQRAPVDAAAAATTERPPAPRFSYRYRVQRRPP